MLLSGKNSLAFFEREILHWYKQYGRKDLPWRKRNISAYEVWVSEIMLQQTQVSRVIDFYNKFLERFPTIFHLAKISWETLLPYYQGLGYYRRGRNMLETAKMIVKEYQGKFPQDKKLLMQLPGIGEYTAHAILSFGYRKNNLAFDTNLQKVFGRFLHGRKAAPVNQALIRKKLSSDKWLLNGAIMDFANLVCLKNPLCDTCPVASKCEYKKQKGKQESRESQGIIPQGMIPFGKSLRGARVMLILHKDHKKYYSEFSEKYRPFLLPTGVRTREEIKKYFELKYRLIIAVRPPHKRIIFKRKLTVLVNAQILLGKNPFFSYLKEKCDILKKI